MRQFALFLLGTLLALPTLAADFGTVDALSGRAYVVEADGQPAELAVGQQLHEGQTIATDPASELHIATVDGGLLALRPASRFHVAEYRNADQNSAGKAALRLLKGALRSITGLIGRKERAAYRLDTSIATIGIRGTDHEATVVEDEEPGQADEPGTYESVIEGATYLRTAHGEVEVGPGQYAFAPRDRAEPPLILEKPPEFAGKRVLKIEGRIQERKEALKRLYAGLPNDKQEQLGELRESWDSMNDAQREAAKRKLRRKLQEHRN